MPTITEREYKNLVQRQAKVEGDLNILKKIVLLEAEEENIRPVVLRRWEKISRDLDRGRGRSFDSAKEVKKGLKHLGK